MTNLYLTHMSLICLKMDERSKQPLPWIAIAFHKLHARGYDTIYCKYSHSDQQKGTIVTSIVKEDGSHS